MLEIDDKSPPFDQFSGIRLLVPERSGHGSGGLARHQLYAARDRRTRANVLIKVISKPGRIYEQDLANEIATLTVVNRELPDSRYFPLLGEHGRLRDGRVYLTMSLFDEWPLATAIGRERLPARQFVHVRTAIEVADALIQLHGLRIWHVDLNPMNVLTRWEAGRPVVRIVDFESSYEVARHSKGEFYNPPTTSGFTAPELARQAPDARADVFSLGAILYTMLAGHEWTWASEVGRSVDGDRDITPELRELLLTAVDADPDRRFPTMADLRSALVGYLESVWPGRPW